MTDFWSNPKNRNEYVLGMHDRNRQQMHMSVSGSEKIPPYDSQMGHPYESVAGLMYSNSALIFNWAFLRHAHM